MNRSDLSRAFGFHKYWNTDLNLANLKIKISQWSVRQQIRRMWNSARWSQYTSTNLTRRNSRCWNQTYGSLLKKNPSQKTRNKKTQSPRGHQHKAVQTTRWTFPWSAKCLSNTTQKRNQLVIWNQRLKRSRSTKSSLAKTKSNSFHKVARNRKESISLQAHTLSRGSLNGAQIQSLCCTRWSLLSKIVDLAMFISTQKPNEVNNLVSYLPLLGLQVKSISTKW